MSNHQIQPGDNPDWESVETEVVRKLRLLRIAWEHSAGRDRALHEMMARDLYIPTLKHLARFCASVQEES